MRLWSWWKRELHACLHHELVYSYLLENCPILCPILIQMPRIFSQSRLEGSLLSLVSVSRDNYIPNLHKIVFLDCIHDFELGKVDAKTSRIRPAILVVGHQIGISKAPILSRYEFQKTKGKTSPCRR